jgi:hypothetical protein
MLNGDSSDRIGTVFFASNEVESCQDSCGIFAVTMQCVDKRSERHVVSGCLKENSDSVVLPYICAWSLDPTFSVLELSAFFMYAL